MEQPNSSKAATRPQRKRKQELDRLELDHPGPSAVRAVTGGPTFGGRRTRGSAKRRAAATNQLGAKVMGNPLVLHKIAKKMKVKELRALRLTCKFWNMTFVPHLKKKVDPIRLFTRRSCFGRATVDNISHRIKKLIELKKSGAKVTRGGGGKGLGLPFTKYQIALDSGSNQQKKSFDSFVKEIGPSTTKLELEWQSIADLSIPRLRKLLFRDTPALEELTLDPSGHDDTTSQPLFVPKVIPNLKHLVLSSTVRSRPLATLLTEVISWAPNLESMEYIGGTCHEQFMVSLLRGMQDSVPDLEKLKTLKLGRITLPTLEALDNLAKTQRLRLQTFVVKVEYVSQMYMGMPDLDMEEEINLHLVASTLESFLVQQTPNLRNLKLAFECNYYDEDIIRPETGFHIPRMEHLHVFELGREGGSPVDIHFAGHSFVDAFPNLQEFAYYFRNRCFVLDVHNDDESNPNPNGAIANSHENFLRDSAQMYHPGVKKLTVKQVNPAQLAQFPSWFPAVKDLDVCLDDHTQEEEALEDCWSLWPELERLNGKGRPGTTVPSKKVLPIGFEEAVDYGL